jgi:hypothetical protein
VREKDLTKRFRRVFWDRRAITPVLSNILLMAVAVAAMSIAATATYVITTNLRDTMGERFIIEDLWFNDNQMSICVRNVGKVSIRISTVYVNSTPQPSQTLDLDIDEHGWLNVSYPWMSGIVYYVDVVTTRGTHVGGYYKAP